MIRKCSMLFPVFLMAVLACDGLFSEREATGPELVPASAVDPDAPPAPFNLAAVASDSAAVFTATWEWDGGIDEPDFLFFNVWYRPIGDLFWIIDATTDTTFTCPYNRKRAIGFREIRLGCEGGLTYEVRVYAWSDRTGTPVHSEFSETVTVTTCDAKGNGLCRP